ncbi:MAG: head-tail adaptor, partial [Proteobacteria bacterium]|nr:head-tail adaptor [Pseudomonadota bacterium]
MNHVLNSAGGGFTTAIAETYMDIPAYGMSTFSVEADPRTGVRFIARDLNQTYCELDERGNIDVIFREV